MAARPAGVRGRGSVFGLFGTYTSAPNIAIVSQDLKLDDTVTTGTAADTIYGGLLTVTLRNQGTGSVQVSAVSGGTGLSVPTLKKADFTTAATTADLTISGNAVQTIYINIGQDADLVPGQAYSFTINLGAATLTVVTTSHF